MAGVQGCYILHNDTYTISKNQGGCPFKHKKINRYNNLAIDNKHNIISFGAKEY